MGHKLFGAVKQTIGGLAYSHGVAKHPWRPAGCPKKPKWDDTHLAGDRGWSRDLAWEDQHSSWESVGEGKQGQGHAQENEKSLLGMNSCLQSEDQNLEGKTKEGTKMTQKAWYAPNLGWIFFGWAWYLMMDLQCKFQQIWRKFCQFWIFLASKQIFLPNA